ncbi:MAG TPA: carbohydrate kinase family protein, partial [Anaerolineales bacterium]|nr:carbohydrate kinase family protein [Anaerolineales bacterium]
HQPTKHKLSNQEEKFLYYMTGTGSISEVSPTTYDFLAMGEIVIDFISNDVTPSLGDAEHFTRFVGGQATNLALNMSRLNNRTAVAACVGYDGLGQFARLQIEQAGINPIFLQTTREAPTTTATITRQTQTPDFIIHRGADAYLRSSNQLGDAARSSKIIHTSAFALSREPARTTILNALNLAHEAGMTISLDPNYHPDIWPDKPNFTDILIDAFQLVDITKPSLEDCARLFGPRNTPDEYAQIFLDWGAEIVLISMGERGVYLACATGEQYEISATENLKVVDVTGAGDAYWAGFLSGYLQDLEPINAARMGQAFAEKKISQVGPLRIVPNWDELNELASKIKYSPNSTNKTKIL